jgi:hypothetical protein
MPQDAYYAATRRMPYPSNGIFPTVTVHGGESFNSETGAKTPTENTYTVRWMAKETTSYSMLVRASAAQAKVGEATFIMWLPDIEANFTALDSEDFITFEGVRYDVVSSERFRTGLLVTATEQRGGSR